MVLRQPLECYSTDHGDVERAVAVTHAGCIHGNVAENQAILAGPRADYLERRFVNLSLETPAPGLPIHGGHPRRPPPSGLEAPASVDAAKHASNHRALGQ